MKKTIKFLVVAIFTGLCFILIQWIFFLVGFSNDFELKHMALQGVVFGLIYTPAYFLMTKVRKENKK